MLFWRCRQCCAILLNAFCKKNFVVAHCNFKLRADDSDGDEEFVKKLCKQNSIEFYSKSFDTKKLRKLQKFNSNDCQRFEIRFF